jgi:Fur family peroxide stress response transcriptional regulator
VKAEDQEVERRLEQFKSAAKEAGIKLTHQRLEIFRAAASSVEHPSAEAVYKAVRRTMPTVSLDTVYRTLWLHHYLCVRCGLVRDFESTELNALPLPDSVSRFGEVVSAHVEVRGVCAKCAAELAEGLAAEDPNPQEGGEGAGDD